MTPAFSPSVTQYTINWPNPGAAQTVTAQATNAGDEITVYADFVSDGAMDLDGPPPKTYGGSDETPLKINIIVSNGEDETRYIVRNSYYS